MGGNSGGNNSSDSGFPISEIYKFTPTKRLKSSANARGSGDVNSKSEWIGYNVEQSGINSLTDGSFELIFAKQPTGTVQVNSTKAFTLTFNGAAGFFYLNLADRVWQKLSPNGSWGEDENIIPDWVAPLNSVGPGFDTSLELNGESSGAAFPIYITQSHKYFVIGGITSNPALTNVPAVYNGSFGGCCPPLFFYISNRYTTPPNTTFNTGGTNASYVVAPFSVQYVSSSIS